MSHSRELAWRLFMIVALLTFACREKERETVLFDGTGLRDAQWKDVFHQERLIPLDLPDSIQQTIRLRSVYVATDGTLFVPDGANHRILRIDPESGTLRGTIGKPGQGPGEISILASMALDTRDNLLVYDVDGRRVSRFLAPDYRFERSFFLDSSATLIKTLAEGDLLIYSPSNEKVLRRYDGEGRLLAEGLTPENEDLRIFLSRVQSGGLALDSERRLIYAIFPENYAIFEMNSDLEVQRTLLAKSGDSEWRPFSPSLPVGLSPYKYGPRHEKWWDSFLHVQRIYHLGSNLLGVTVSKSKGMGTEAQFLNLYSVAGSVLAEGLEVPNGGMVIWAGDGRVLVAHEPYLSEGGEVVPAELREYYIDQDFMAPNR